MEEFMERLKKFTFLTPILVLTNLFVTALLAGDLINDLAEKLFQDVMKKTDAAVLAIILSYTLYFVGLLIIITLANKIFNTKKKDTQNSEGELNKSISITSTSKTNINLIKRNVDTSVTNVSLENLDIEIEMKNNSKYNTYNILLKIIICITLIGVFGFKILLTKNMSEMVYFMKIIFIIFQLSAFFIVFCCIIKTKVNDINSFKSLFFIDEGSKETICGKIYKICWVINITALLFMLSYLVMIIFGIDVVAELEALKDFKK